MPQKNEALRETQTLHALAVVRFGHCGPPVTDRTDYNTLRRS